MRLKFLPLFFLISNGFWGVTRAIRTLSLSLLSISCKVETFRGFQKDRAEFLTGPELRRERWRKGERCGKIDCDEMSIFLVFMARPVKVCTRNVRNSLSVILNKLLWLLRAIFDLNFSERFHKY